MDGFGDALDGCYDAADQVTRYVLGRAEEQFADTRAAKRSLDARADFEARRERVRETFLDGVGGLPDRPDDLAAEVVGHVARDGYAVERLVFASHPDHRVTANCYVPEGEGPHPGILFCCGHTDDPRGDPANQRACIELALNGFVVLVADPIGQGERVQYADVERVSGVGGGVSEHCHAGQKCFYAGANLARYVIHDDLCALDYLCGRGDVDADRIGVTGTSGGGTQTLYLGLLDDRIDAAAPCCTVTTRREWLKTGKRIDAEQLIYGAITAGIDYDDLLAGLAPTPVCVGAAASDRYFPVEGVREVLDRVRGIYDLYDAADRVELTVAETGHCAVWDLREGVFPFLCAELGDGDYEPSGDIDPVDWSRLRCTAEGSVREAYADERSIDDLVAEYVAERSPEPVAGSAGARSRDVDPDAVRDRIVDGLALDREGADLHPRFVDRSEDGGLTVERVWFRTERDPDAVVAGVLATDPDAGAPVESPAVVRYEDGTGELPERSEAVAALAREHGAALVFDPRGVGAVRNRPIPIPWFVEDYEDHYDEVYGTAFKHAYDALLLGESPLGWRVYDTLRAAAFLRRETGADRVSLVGEGTGAFDALYAAAAAEAVDRVALRDPGPTFRERATERDVPYDPALMVFDALDIDVPRALAALDERGVDVDRSGGE